MDMKNNVEEILTLLHKFLRELQSFFIENKIPIAKGIEADMLEMVAPEIGENNGTGKIISKLCQR